MVWIIHWHCPHTGESDISVWASQQDALRQACNEVLVDVIGSAWDLSDPATLIAAKHINELVSKGSYEAALDEYHYEQDNACSFSGDEQYWDILERDENTHPKPPTLLTFANGQDDDEDEEDERDITIREVAIFVATIPGATCRGPCKNHSPDAYADKADGTFVCYQCKLMSQAFGGKAP